MIPRILVPRDVRPAADRADAPPPRRLTTLLDDRTVVAANLPRADLQTHSDIPCSYAFGRTCLARRRSSRYAGYAVCSRDGSSRLRARDRHG